MNKAFEEKRCPLCGEIFHLRNVGSQTWFINHMNRCSQEYKIKWMVPR